MFHFTPKLPTVNKPTSVRIHTFTLIEMLVVVVIIGILAGVLVPRLVGAKERASDSGRMVKVWQISSAVELYAQEKGTTYPLAPLTATGTSIARQDITDAISPYMTTIPTDPGKWTVAISGYDGNILVTGDSFAYWTNTWWTVYAITALMESKKGNTTNATEVIDSDKQWWYQKVGKWLTTNIVAGGGGGWPTNPITNYWADIEITYNGKTHRIKDRNVGATQAGTGQASYGYYYQRGNNFGFWNGIAWYTNQDWSATITTTSTLVSSPSPWYTNSTFVLAPNSPWNWATPSNANLRPAGGQWPCPTGYHIPTITEREDIVLYYKWNGTGLMNWLQLPKAGYRDYDSAASVLNQGVYGLYWSSSTISDPGPYYLYLRSDGVNNFAYGSRAKGYSVRCFKDSP